MAEPARSGNTPTRRFRTERMSWTTSLAETISASGCYLPRLRITSPPDQEDGIMRGRTVPARLTQGISALTWASSSRRRYDILKDRPRPLQVIRAHSADSGAAVG